MPDLQPQPNNTNMKSTSIIAAVSLAAFTSAGAQTFVLDSPVVITSSIRTQDADETTTRKDTTVVVKSLDQRRFNNRQIISRMIERALLTGSAEEWKLAYLSDETGKGGIYAKKSGATPVAVPADLLTLPVFGPSVTTGRETTGPNGGTYVGTTEISSATITVDGIPAAGLATNGIRTITASIKGITYQLETVSTTMTFSGGIDGTPSDSILDGLIVIGSAKVSELKKLP